MRAAVIQRQAEPGQAIAQNITVTSDWPEPAAPGQGQATVRTLAASLNHLDLWVARGVPGLNLAYPRVSGSDACGIVEAVGPGVDAAWVGRKVVLNAAIDMA
ncbi:MAG: alcohol dehydrogenase catalytic domain-containing protein, partial [Phycisphaerales bacterium]|nr:alcohol dehydrogenase catalytic domain-containing protein [Phycisphaerales bacterium]